MNIVHSDSKRSHSNMGTNTLFFFFDQPSQVSNDIVLSKLLNLKFLKYVFPYFAIIYHANSVIVILQM